MCKRVDTRRELDVDIVESRQQQEPTHGQIERYAQIWVDKFKYEKLDEQVYKIKISSSRQTSSDRQIQVQGSDRYT